MNRDELKASRRNAHLDSDLLGDLLEGLEPPAVPLGLRQRVLTRARSQTEVAPSWVDRLWESPSLRWGWVVSVLLLVVIQTGLAASMGEPAAPRSASAAAPAVEVVPELEGDYDLGVWLARHPVREAESRSPWGLRPEDERADRRL